MIALNNLPVRRLSLLLFLTFAFLIIGYPQKANAAYDGARIIDDKVFLDAKSMTSDQIQKFLDSKGGGIADRPFTMNCASAGSYAEQEYKNLGAPCGKQTTAAKIIYYSSQVYGMNPRVILATIQKEQSLVTSPNPTRRQMKQAMGYACPTSGNCDDTSTFFWQIDNGSWALRFHFERARGNFMYWYESDSWVCGSEKEYYSPNLFPNQNVKFIDENGVHYRTYFIENAATSAMYCYTPHAYNNPEGLYGREPFGTKGLYYSGSYNFVYWFEIWFGPTTINNNVRLVQCGSDKYIVERGIEKKRLITGDASAAWKIENSFYTSGDRACSYPTYDTDLGRLIRSRKSGKVYLVDEAKAYYIKDQSSADAWNLGSLSQVLPQFDPDSIHDNLRVIEYMPRIAKSTNTGRLTYYLVNTGDRHIISGTVTGDNSSLELIRGYNEVPRGIFSVALLQTLPEHITPINYSFQINGTWYLLDHNRTRRITDDALTSWEGLLEGPSLSTDTLNIFRANRSIGRGFERYGYFYRTNSGGLLERTTSSEIAASWIPDGSPTITRLLTEKILGDSGSLTTVKQLNGNVRLISCNNKHYLVERFIRKKRLLISEVVQKWNLDDYYFFENDRGCDYPEYDLSANDLIRSRDTKKVYYIENGTSYYVHSKEAGESRGFGDVSLQTYPQFNGKSIHDLFIVEKQLPSNP